MLTVAAGRTCVALALASCSRSRWDARVSMAMPPRLYDAYTAEEDAYLWAHKEQPLEEVANELGRGSKSCGSRLERLRNPKTEGYRRLFGADELEADLEAGLRPVRDCLQRIQHDYSLNAADFRVGYSDRFSASAREVR